MKASKSGRLTRAALVGTVVLGVGVASSAGGCSAGFGSVRPIERLVVTVEQGDVGAPDARLPLSFTQVFSYTVKIVAQKPDGSVDAGYNGFVRVSSHPGTIVGITGPGAAGRNVQLSSGVADGVVVKVVAAYGDTRLWVEDLGYLPADPARNPPPQCADGLDNDGDGALDFPADDGCAFANDDTETGATYSAGTTPPIYYTKPRIADVRGVSQPGSGTSFPHEQVDVDTGWRGAENFTFKGGVVVTRVSSDGFYATDLDDNDVAGGGRGFGSVFAYNFSAPSNMRQCNRLRTFGGTSSDFFGFTEVNYPTWALEEWDPSARPCLIPEPHTLAWNCSTVAPSTTPDCFIISDATALASLQAALVRLGNYPPTKRPRPNPDPDPTSPDRVDAPGVAIHVAQHFGPGHPVTPAFLSTNDASNCDLNNDGKVNRTAPKPGLTNDELTCATACDLDIECSEFSNYLSQSSFYLVVQGIDIGGGVLGVNKIQANGSTDAQLDPVSLHGQPIRSFTGTLRYFSGGSQFTIEARCADDIVLDLNASPVPSDTACVHARTTLDTSAGSN